MIMTDQGTILEYADLSDEQRRKLARLVADDNMEDANAGFQPYKVRDCFYTRYGKRALDFLIAIVALTVFAPVNLAILVITYFDVGRPIFFRQERAGKDGKVFTLVKFRNMTNECDANGNLLPAEQRVTKWGRFVRRTSLDELLNFWSILKGDMSVIGPRPLPLDYYERFSKRHNMRHLVRPGLECPMHGGLVDDMSWQMRFENDVWYVQHISFLTDVKLLWGLFADTFWSEKRKQRGKGIGASGGDFIGYRKDGTAVGAFQIPIKYYAELTKLLKERKPGSSGGQPGDVLSA